jgi:hypothetical protein
LNGPAKPFSTNTVQQYITQHRQAGDLHLAARPPRLAVIGVDHDASVRGLDLVACRAQGEYAGEGIANRDERCATHVAHRRQPVDYSAAAIANFSSGAFSGTGIND